MRFISYSQNFEDILLWRALGHIPKGFYIDVGAGDPVKDSVTQAFYQRGWHGVNVEPARQFYDKLRIKRPADTNLPIAAGHASGALIFFEIPDSPLSSADAARAERHRASGKKVVQRQVQAQSLADICASHVQGPIHFLRIDVAGTERAVIEGMDFQQWRPWIVLLAVGDGSPNAREPALRDAGYDQVFFDGFNAYYVAKEHPGLARAFQAPANLRDDFILCPEHPFAYPLTEFKDALQEARTAKRNAEIVAYEATVWADARGEELAQKQAARAHLAEVQVLEEGARTRQAEALAQQQANRAEQAEGLAQQQSGRAEQAEALARQEAARAQQAEADVRQAQAQAEADVRQALAQAEQALQQERQAQHDAAQAQQAALQAQQAAIQAQQAALQAQQAALQAQQAEALAKQETASAQAHAERQTAWATQAEAHAQLETEHAALAEELERQARREAKLTLARALHAEEYADQETARARRSEAYAQNEAARALAAESLALQAQAVALSEAERTMHAEAHVQIQTSRAEQAEHNAERQAQLLAQLAAHGQRNAELQAQRAERAEQHLTAIATSLSWRITQPIREAAGLLRGSVKWLAKAPTNLATTLAAAPAAAKMQAKKSFVAMIRAIMARPRLALFLRRRLIDFPSLNAWARRFVPTVTQSVILHKAQNTPPATPAAPAFLARSAEGDTPATVANNQHGAASAASMSVPANAPSPESQALAESALELPLAARQVLDDLCRSIDGSRNR